jgi:hypothetical protein
MRYACRLMVFVVLAFLARTSAWADDAAEYSQQTDVMSVRFLASTSMPWRRPGLMIPRSVPYTRAARPCWWAEMQ